MKLAVVSRDNFTTVYFFGSVQRSHKKAPKSKNGNWIKDHLTELAHLLCAFCAFLWLPSKKLNSDTLRD